MNTIDELVKHEWKTGVSAGAAARQLCRSLDPDSPLKLLLDAMLADANDAAQDRAIILNEIMEFDLNFGQQLKLASLNRINHRDRPEVTIIEQNLVYGIPRGAELGPLSKGEDFRKWWSRGLPR